MKTNLTKKELKRLLWLCGDALEGVIQNDKTTYEPDEPRPDGKLAREVDGSSAWVTPKQIAEAVYPQLRAAFGMEVQA